MSTVLPSTSAIPLVMSGTAVTPPVPVKVATPAPSRRIHASSVNVEAPELRRRPERHIRVGPAQLQRRVDHGRHAVHTTVTASLVESSPSLAVSVST